MVDCQKLLAQALAHHRGGALGAAAQLYQQILQHNPQHADALHLLGVIARQLGKTPLALALLQQAIAAHPHHAPALTNLALLLREQGDLAAARNHADRAIAADPSNAEALHTLGGILAAEQDYQGALAAYRQALALQPEAPLILNDFANAARRAGLLTAAYTAINRACALAPSHALLHHTRGTVLRAAGYADRASAAYAEALRCDAAQTETRTTAALCHFLRGDFASGWPLYADRAAPEPRYAALTAWNGQSAVPLLLHAEQGLGDTLQFIRLVNAVQAHVPKLVIEVQPPLLRLLQLSLPQFSFITPNAPLPREVTHHCRLLDAAQWFSVPPTPYLQAPPLSAAQSAMLSAIKTPRLGLVWAGNPGHLNDANRSIALATLAPALRPYQAQIVSLQKGDAIKDIAQNQRGVADGGALCTDFADTAALIQALDLVITVDTSVAHLAGGMGTPVWLLLPFDPDWRWQLQRRDTPWYPTMKLYRQQQPQDWSAPLQDLAADLANFIAGDRNVLIPPRWTQPPAQQTEQPVEI